MTRLLPVRALSLVLGLAPGAMPNAHAFELGTLSVESALGQRLLAEIEIFSTTAENAAAMQVGLADDAAYERLGVSLAGKPSDIDMAIVSDPGGQPVIRLSTKEPVHDPVLNLLLQIEDRDIRRIRELAILLDPGGRRAADLPPAIGPADVLEPSRPERITEIVATDGIESDRPSTARRTSSVTAMAIPPAPPVAAATPLSNEASPQRMEPARVGNDVDRSAEPASAGPWTLQRAMRTLRDVGLLTLALYLVRVVVGRLARRREERARRATTSRPGTRNEASGKAMEEALEKARRAADDWADDWADDSAGRSMTTAHLARSERLFRQPAEAAELLAITLDYLYQVDGLDLVLDEDADDLDDDPAIDASVDAALAGLWTVDEDHPFVDLGFRSDEIDQDLARAETCIDRGNGVEARHLLDEILPRADAPRRRRAKALLRRLDARGGDESYVA